MWRPFPAVCNSLPNVDLISVLHLNHERDGRLGKKPEEGWNDQA